MEEEIVGGTYIFLILFLIVLGILWFLLPFAIFGTKRRLDSLITEVRQINSELKVLTGAMPPSSSNPPLIQRQNLTHDQTMAVFGISNDGQHYIVDGQKFANLADAASYAQAKGRG